MVTIHCEDAHGVRFASFQLASTDTLEDLMVLIAAERGIDVGDQYLSHAGRHWTSVDGHLHLSEAGLGAGETTLTVRLAPPPASGGTRAGGEEGAARILQLFRDGVESEGAARTLVSHETDVEVQRRLYEAIQSRNIDESLASALEHTPEAFASVVMLYIPCTINGEPVTAFVDSGAQMSIMNERTAERCGLLRLLDTRIRGIAKGVGTQEILGRIHLTTVNLGGLFIPFSFSVLKDQSIDVIIGLDQLRRHQMILDLQQGCLRIHDTSIPFLVEAELPAELRSGAPEEAEEAPAVVPPGDPPRPPSTSPERSAPPVPALSPEKEAKLQALLTVTNLEDRARAMELLEMTQWNVAVASSFFFDE